MSAEDLTLEKQKWKRYSRVPGTEPHLIHALPVEPLFSESEPLSHQLYE